MIRELNIKQKDKLGAGAYHDVFPFHKFQDKVIKTRQGTLSIDKNGVTKTDKVPMDSKELKIFQDNPDLFVKVYVAKPNYAVLEKLDTEHFRRDAQKLSDGVWKYLDDSKGKPLHLPYYFDSDSQDSTDIDAVRFIWLCMKHKLYNILDGLRNYLPPKYYSKFLKFLKQLYDKGYKNADVHEYNFGYNQQGEIRMLDF